MHESWKKLRRWLPRMGALVNVWWKKVRPWLPKIIGLIVVPVIFYQLLRPIFAHWDDIRPEIDKVNWWFVGLAALMFSANQFWCRITSWRGVLRGLGWRMPVRPACRVWASGELARFVPGVIWQVVGRAYLAKQYGLPMITCSISQVLELTICLLANVIVAVSTLWLISDQIADERVKLALRLATALIPVLMAFLHPRVFYPVVNAVLRKLKKPTIDVHISGRRMLGLLLLGIAGQAWLGLAIWLATMSVLQLRITDVWMVAGAYCLAWSAGFCMGSIAPAGIGIRELVLAGTLGLLVGSRMGVALDPQARKAIFAAMALLLRVWATSGELIFAGIAYSLDIDGARGRVRQMAERVGQPVGTATQARFGIRGKA